MEADEVGLTSARRAAACFVATGALAVGLLALSGTAPAAAVTCPTVSSVGTVSPPAAPKVNWSGCDLSGANLTSADLGDADLDGANLTSADLTSANLAVVKLYTADLAGANLTSAN